jgi:mono/diheme cytochrome c family protein
MAATSRWGILLLLAGCGGGQAASRSDTAAMSGASPTDTAMSGAAAMSGADTSATAGAANTPAATSADTAASDPSRPTGTKGQDTAKKTAAARQDTAKKAPAAKQDTSKKAAAAQPSSGGPTPQQVALGDSIFHGQVAGGTCTACHGQDAKGTAVAPDLTDSQWLNGDGSYQFIVHTVTTGVPHPKQHPAPMPPKGGATLTDDQVKAVAAYVYSLSHKI